MPPRSTTEVLISVSSAEGLGADNYTNEGYVISHSHVQAMPLLTCYPDEQDL